MLRTRQNAARAISDPTFFFKKTAQRQLNTGAERFRHSLTHGYPGVHCQNFPPTGEGEDMVNVSKEGQIFKCEICGNVVVVKEAGGGELICCGEPMILEE
jgi:desulfoferrodoxin-like iron-binding protein